MGERFLGVRSLINRDRLGTRSVTFRCCLGFTLDSHAVLGEPGFDRIFVEIEPERTRKKATEKCYRVLEDFLTKRS